MRKRKTVKVKLQNKLWELCKTYIRRRDKNTCQWCGKKVEKTNAHTSHVIPKSHGNVLRYDDLNLKLLCFHCHINKFHKNPLESAEWFKKKFPDRYEHIQEKKEQIVKLKEVELQDLIEHYEDLLVGLDMKEGRI